ncbi:MAG: DSD1 family PLP-dependent enzyme [Longimicrobiales bacterium]
MQFADIATPALLLDTIRMDRNIARMRSRVRELGAGFRPHLKTSKCIDVASRLFDGGIGPITVSTLKEAEYFFGHGYTDILYAVGITTVKLRHVADLRARGCDLKIILDNDEAAVAVSALATQSGSPIPTLIELDTDGHRSGVAPEDDDLLRIGQLLGACLAGVLTHAGASYDCSSVEAIRALAEQERARSVTAAVRLRGAGLWCPIVSVGSTPTATYAQRLDGVTEVRAGVFVFFDLVMAGISVCTVDDIALSVLATVIGHQRNKGWLITDAGWMAMSRDRGTAKQPVDQGYGLVCDETGVTIPDLIMTAANQEHGIVAHRSGDPARTPLLPVGTRLRILPNHACATGAQHDRYHVVTDASTNVETTWKRFSGW